MSIHKVESIAPVTTSNKQRWLYSIASIGTVMPTNAVGAFMLFYYTDVKHLPVAWAATAMVIFTIYDAVNNPILGYLSDRTKTRWGRRIPYIMFGAAPYALFFALIWMVPFDGISRPIPTLIYFVVVSWIWEGLSTAVLTGYYSLLPEMFVTYAERTDVSVRMNVALLVGLLIGMAVPPLLYSSLGWPMMGIIFAIIATISLYVGLRGMFERESSIIAESISLRDAIKATFVNGSFITVTLARTFRVFGTAGLAMGTAFYVKYSLQIDESFTAVILATTFVSSGIALWFWRRFIAQRFGGRTTLMIANVVVALAVIPFALVQTTVGVLLGCVLVGVGLGGVFLMEDVVLADVIDEDEVKTGQRREGMYFGTSAFIQTTLSHSLASIVFAWIASTYGYDSALTVQPETVATGFRIFLSVPSIIGSSLAVAALFFYPLYGKRLQTVKDTLATRKPKLTS